MSTCANHPIKMASARCKCCNKPLCNECKRSTDMGIFCSPECETRTRQFNERASGTTVVHRTSFLKTLRSLAIVALVIGGLGAAAHFGLGLELDDVTSTLGQWWEARRLFLPW